MTVAAGPLVSERAVRIRLDGDSAVLSGSVDGGYYGLSRALLTPPAWDSHVAAIHRAEGRHSVQITPDGLRVRWRNPGDYAGRHRREAGT